MWIMCDPRSCLSPHASSIVSCKGLWLGLQQFNSLTPRDIGMLRQIGQFYETRQTSDPIVKLVSFVKLAYMLILVSLVRHY